MSASARRACQRGGRGGLYRRGKLIKQLWAGSGFSATVSVEVAAKEGMQAMSTLKPIVMDVSYIYVRPTATETAEHRADVVLRTARAPSARRTRSSRMVPWPFRPM